MTVAEGKYKHTYYMKYRSVFGDICDEWIEAYSPEAAKETLFSDSPEVSILLRCEQVGNIYEDLK